MKTKVLLVEDDTETRESYTKILTAAGYEVTLMARGEEVLGAINGAHPDVILMDGDDARHHPGVWRTPSGCGRCGLPPCARGIRCR